MQPWFNVGPVIVTGQNLSGAWEERWENPGYSPQAILGSVFDGVSHTLENELFCPTDSNIIS